jgi:hypothetical protein
MKKVCDLSLRIWIFRCAAKTQFIVYVILKQKKMVDRPSFLQKKIYLLECIPNKVGVVLWLLIIH